MLTSLLQQIPKGAFQRVNSGGFFTVGTQSHASGWDVYHFEAR